MGGPVRRVSPRSISRASLAGWGAAGGSAGSGSTGAGTGRRPTISGSISVPVAEGPELSGGARQDRVSKAEQFSHTGAQRAWMC